MTASGLFRAAKSNGARRPLTPRARELKEETGLLALTLTLGDVADQILKDGTGTVTVHYTIIVFATRDVEGMLAPASDAAAAGFGPEERTGLKRTPGLESAMRTRDGLGKRQKMTLQAVKPAFLAIIATIAAAVAPAPACAQNAAGAQKQHQAPAPTPPKPAAADERHYDAQLFRLAEFLGTLHYLWELCGANEGQVWREHMRELTASEGTSALRRAKLVESSIAAIATIREPIAHAPRLRSSRSSATWSRHRPSPTG